MTRAQWDAMELRERDAVVAEKVMGLEYLCVGYFGTEDETPRMRELHGWMGRVGIWSVGSYFVNVDSDFWIEAERRQYTTSWDAMREVVEKMRAAGWSWSVDHTWGARYARAGFTRLHKDEYASGYAEAAPEAVCIAALTALGHMEGA